MKDQILAAFKKAKVPLPPEVQESLSEENLARRAEKIYTNTTIELHGTMERDLAAKHGRTAADLAITKIAKKMGIEDAEILSARLHEKTALLAELRGHDALVRMIMKIANSTGIIQDNPETSPTSTLRALKLGVALQFIYGSLMERASDKNRREAELEEQIRIQNIELDRLRLQVGNVQRTPSRPEEDEEDSSEVVAEASKYFMIYGDKPEYDGKVGWLCWETNEAGPFAFDDLPPVNRLKLSNSVKKAMNFKTKEDADQVVERLNRSVLVRRFAQPGSLGVAKIAAVKVE
jgi:hypothetical protein